jgi:hypothetical protein
VPWNAPAFVSVKGVLHQPSGKAMLKPETRDAILLAIGKARTWIDDLVSGRVQSFAEIAQHEGCCSVDGCRFHTSRVAPRHPMSAPV